MFYFIGKFGWVTPAENRASNPPPVGHGGPPAITKKALKIYTFPIDRWGIPMV
jgi:hypothetical protein